MPDTTSITVKASCTIPRSQGVSSPILVQLAGQGISRTANWSATNATNGKASKQAVVSFLAGTGVKNVDLSAVVTPAGTVNFAKVGELFVIIPVINSSGSAQNTAAKSIVGGAASNPFLGRFQDSSDKVEVVVGDFYPFANKFFGDGYSTTNAVNLKIDMGATAHDLYVIIKGE